MENFVVSARKYRPQLFDSVVGQSHITTTLQNAIRTNHLAQAFLFCGPRGVGKTTCARILAKTINCQNLGDEVEACGECDSCKSFSTNSSFNIFELDAASNNSVDDIRNLIDQIRFPPQQGKYKIYIIDEVHMLSTAAFNAFLKTLEEPPSYAIFILATTEKHKILPTILSRCQNFDFNRIKNNDIAEHLENIAQKESISVERAALDLIAQKADGGLRDALSMFDLNVTFSAGQTLGYQQVLENLHILDYDYYFKIVAALFEGNLATSLLLFNEIIAKGFDGHQFVVSLNEHFRNLMVSKDPQTLPLLEVSSSVEQKFAEQAKLLPLHYIYSALSIGSQLDLNYKAAKAQKLHVEIGLMKISQLGNLFDLNQLPAAEVEKKNDVAKPKAPEVAVPEVKTEEMAYQPMPTKEELGALKYETKKIGGYKSSKLASSDALEIVETPKSTVKLADIVEEPRAFENREFNQNQLIHAWSDFLKTRDLAIEQVMLDRDFTFIDNQIKIVFDNEVQMQQFDLMKQELMNFLRLKLHNNTFTIEAIQGKYEAKERLPYTAQEKYDYLLRKNPTVAKLKERFNLELSH